MRRRTGFILCIVVLAPLSFLAVSADAIKGGIPINSGSSSAAVQAAATEPSTTDPVRINLGELAYAATSTTATPATTTPATTAPPRTTTTVAPVPSTTPTTKATITTTTMAVAASECDTLDVFITSGGYTGTLTAHCGKATKVMPITAGGEYWYNDSQSGELVQAHTPRGSFAIYYLDPGMVQVPLGWMYNSMYFLDGFAIHGGDMVPSHGCVHVSNTDADWLFDRVSIGTVVNIH